MIVFGMCIGHLILAVRITVHVFIDALVDMRRMRRMHLRHNIFLHAVGDIAFWRVDDGRHNNRFLLAMLLWLHLRIVIAAMMVMVIMVVVVHVIPIIITHYNFLLF